MNVGMPFNQNLLTFQYNKREKMIEETMERLSSGKRINKAADDSANIAVSNRMEKGITGSEKANKNIEDGKSLMQTAESGLKQIVNAIQRMRELAVEAANGTYDYSQRQSLQNEFDELKEHIDSIANSTEFNGIKVLRPPVHQPPLQNGKADIVFVIDDTASMSSIQTEVANNLSTLVSTLDTKGVTDVRYGIYQYKDYTLEQSSFGGSIWTSDENAVKTEILNIASTNSGGVENLMQALTDVANQYDYRPNEPSSQTKHIIFVTNEDADDEAMTSSTLSALNAQGIQVHGVYYKQNSDVQELDTVVATTGGKSIDLADANWGDRLSIEIGGAIGQESGADEDMPKINLHIGEGAEDTTEVELMDARVSKIGLTGTDILSQAGAEIAMDKLDAAMEKVLSQESYYGAITNRLDYTYQENSSYQINMTQSLSRIEDADMAYESSVLTKNKILQQSSYILFKEAMKNNESFYQMLMN